MTNLGSIYKSLTDPHDIKHHIERGLAENAFQTLETIQRIALDGLSKSGGDVPAIKALSAVVNVTSTILEERDAGTA